jgi:hypothetical protein
MSGGCGYTLAIMNDAIKPGPETLSQAGLPELSVVVPTFNERDNVTGAVPAVGGHACRHCLGSGLCR